MNIFDNLGRFKKPAKAGQTPFTDSTDRCERQGYRPSHERIAELVRAGLTTQMNHDRLWDIVADADQDILKDLPQVPPLRRHLDTDLADIQEQARKYASIRRQLEQRLRDKQLSLLDAKRKRAAEEAAIAAAKAASNGSGSSTSPLNQSGSVEPVS